MKIFNFDRRCFGGLFGGGGGGSSAAAAPPPPPAAPPETLADASVSQAGAVARARAAAAAGAGFAGTVQNQGGAAGLTAPAQATRSLLG